MKVRNGFVSNSSSSSFIVAYKNSFKEDFKNEMKNLESSIFVDIIQDIGDCLSRNIEGNFETHKEFFKSDYGDIEYYPYDKVEELLNKGYKIGIGSISDQCDYDKIDNYLCHKSIQYHSDNLVIEKEESY